MTDILRPAPDLYAAGQPGPAQLAALAREGVRTVINLRAASEPVDFDEPAEVAGLGMRYVSLPVAGAQELTPSRAREFSRVLHAARAEGPVLVHCASANRVGALMALDHALVHGHGEAEALARGRAAGLTTLEPRVLELLAHRGP